MKKLLTVFLLLTALSPAYAHKLNVLAIYESGTLNISSYFADGTFCKRCAYTVTGTDGHVIFKGTLSNSGEAVLSGELPSSFTVNVDAGMGHFAKMEVVPEPSADSQPSVSSDTQTSVNSEALRTIIRQELAKQTAEIQTAIDAGRTQTDKIIAGIGYLLGIFGLFMLFRKK